MGNAKEILEKLIGPLTVGMLIRAYRTREGITQQDLADKLDLKVTYISDIENDRRIPSMAKVKEMAEKLGELVAQYIRVWTEQTYRESGLSFEEIVNVRPLKKSAIKDNKMKSTRKTFPDRSRPTVFAKKSTGHVIPRKATHKKATHKKTR